MKGRQLDSGCGGAEDGGLLLEFLEFERHFAEHGRVGARACGGMFALNGHGRLLCAHLALFGGELEGAGVEGALVVVLVEDGVDHYGLLVDC